MSLSVVLAIIFPVVSVALFKEFEKRGVDSFPAIVFNYLGAIIIGTILFVTPTQLTQFQHQPWFISSLVVGFFFILNFYLIAKATVNNGVSIATFANKISLVFPVVFTIFYFNESSNWIKITGIIIALLSIYLLTFSRVKDKSNKYVLFPLFIFVCTGIMESVINYTQKIYFELENEIGYFVISSFMISFLIGIVILFFIKKSFNLKNIVGGLILSISNTFGLYFFVKALNEYADSTTVLPIMNIGTLLLAILVGFFFYKEKLNSRNKIGFMLALLSILLLTLF